MDTFNKIVKFYKEYTGLSLGLIFTFAGLLLGIGISTGSIPLITTAVAMGLAVFVTVLTV